MSVGDDFIEESLVLEQDRYMQSLLTSILLYNDFNATSTKETYF